MILYDLDVGIVKWVAVMGCLRDPASTGSHVAWLIVCDACSWPVLGVRIRRLHHENVSATERIGACTTYTAVNSTQQSSMVLLSYMHPCRRKQHRIIVLNLALLVLRQLGDCQLTG